MNSIFNKINLDIQDLQNLIDFKIERSINIEFCNFEDINIFEEKKLLKLSILVSSMANAIGGVIFFGIKTKRKKAFEIIGGENNQLSCDKIKSVLDLKINKPIKNLFVGKISIKNEFVYYINIPEDNNSPHMNFDYKYYKRVNLKAVLMEENEIRAKYNINNSTEIEFLGILDTSGIPKKLNNGNIETINFFPKFLIKNISSLVEKFYKVELYIPSKLHDSDFNLLQNKFSRLEEQYSVFSEESKSALFQQEIANVLPAKIYVDNLNYNVFEKEYIILKIYYSFGVKEHSLKISNTFTYNNRILTFDDFTNKKQIDNTLFID